MQIFEGLPAVPLSEPTFLTIGNFDGVHCGHQALLGEMVAAAGAARAAQAAGARAGVLTFDPHPLAVLRPDVPLAYLTTPAERARLIGALGADFALILPFSRTVASTSAADFMGELVRRLNLRELWVGPDFALGRGREGNVERLAEIGRELGYSVRVIPPIDLRGEPVRSSRVRWLLGQEGDVERAAEMLGRPYEVWGVVEAGARRGQTLGYPTANLALDPDRVAPAFGIYACWAWLDEADGPERGGSRGEGPAAGHMAAVSVGTRPTFDNGRPTIEAYLLDFEGELYGRRLGLSFVKRLRAELRFESAAALVEQMERDVALTRAILAEPVVDAGVADDAKAADGRVEAGGLAGGGGLRSGVGWQELAHTADWTVEVRGASLGELYARAAAAMFGLEEADPGRPVTLARAVSVAGADAGEVLVGYLNRLLWAQEVGGEMYTGFAVSVASERGLEGVAYGYRGAPAHTAVKAATFWDLEVGRAGDGWGARVTFDV